MKTDDANEYAQANPAAYPDGGAFRDLTVPINAAERALYDRDEAERAQMRVDDADRRNAEEDSE